MFYSVIKTYYQEYSDILYYIEKKVVNMQMSL